jgi:protein-tyrosine phosphatase
MTDVLVLCAANMCRSPMAARLLARELQTRGLAAREVPAPDPGVTVRSAGLLVDGEPPAPLATSAMADRGLDISAHRSRVVRPADLTAAGLVLVMARAQLREAVVLVPEAWPRAFTLKELVRRGEQIGPRPSGMSLPGWLAMAHEGRDRAALLGDSPDDDVADPIGGPPQAFAQTADLLSDLTHRLADLCWPAARPDAPAEGRPLDPRGDLGLWPHATGWMDN